MFLVWQQLDVVPAELQVEKDIANAQAEKVISAIDQQENLVISMNRSNRDLLVLFNQELLSPQAMEHEVEMLHEMLFMVEGLENLVNAHEILDLNKYKIIHKKSILRELLRLRELKPFVFLNNKN